MVPPAVISPPRLVFALKLVLLAITLPGFCKRSLIAGAVHEIAAAAARLRGGCRQKRRREQGRGQEKHSHPGCLLNLKPTGLVSRLLHRSVTGARIRRCDLGELMLSLATQPWQNGDRPFLVTARLGDRWPPQTLN